MVSILYNFQLLKIAGEDGVAAYGVIMYLNFIFIAIFLGYAIGTAPIYGYNYGAGNEAELQNVFRKSMIVNTVLGILLGTANHFISPYGTLPSGSSYDFADVLRTGWNLVFHYGCGNWFHAGDFLLFGEKKKEILLLLKETNTFTIPHGGSSVVK